MGAGWKFKRRSPRRLPRDRVDGDELYRLRLFDCTSRGSASTWPLPAATSGRRYNALERNWKDGTMVPELLDTLATTERLKVPAQDEGACATCGRLLGRRGYQARWGWKGYRLRRGSCVICGADAVIRTRSKGYSKPASVFAISTSSMLSFIARRLALSLALAMPFQRSWI